MNELRGKSGARRPDDIPESVWNAAADCLDRELLAPSRDGDIETIARAMRAAVEGEREACEIIVLRARDSVAGSNEFAQGAMFMADQLYNAIRKRKAQR